MESNEYQVTIKSANQKVDDYVTICKPDWTVLELKQHISLTHINKPNVSGQRLIYAGVILKDPQTLRQIFFRDSLCTELTNSTTDFTIHLVCQINFTKTVNTSPSNSQSTASPSTTVQSPIISTPHNRSTRSTDSARPANIAAPISPTNATNPLPNQTTTANNISSNPQPTADAGSNMNGNPFVFSFGQNINFDSAQQAELVQNLMQSEQMRQQMVVFQQLAFLVAAQIANLACNRNNQNNTQQTTNDQISQAPILLDGLIANLQNINSSPLMNNPVGNATITPDLLYAGNRQQAQFVTPDTPDNRPEVPRENDNVENPNNPNLAAQVQAPEAQVEPAAAVAQPAAAMQDVQMMQRDIIDWVYYSIRAAVLMAALYIHASMFKLLFIVGFLVVAYFYRRTHRRVERADPQQRAPNQHQNDLQAEFEAQGHVDGQNVRRRLVENQNDEINGNDNNNNQLPAGQGVQDDLSGPRRVTFLKLCYLVLTDFLASLVPE